MKVDLCMWTKNGERFLPRVLKRIEEVVPAEVVHKKILVDDHSVDRTVEIAREFNWEVYENPSTGIPAGANEALRHVDCPFFVSVEQDVLLAKDWWDKIPPHVLNSEDVACAEGIRVAVHPVLRKLDLYAYKRLDIPVVSFDNNFFRTRIIRENGYFPTFCYTCTDSILRRMLLKKGYRWIIDRKVVSEHISRTSVEDYLTHIYKMGMLCARSNYCFDYGGTKQLTRILLTSPIRSAILSIVTKEPNMFWLYPLIRYKKLKAFLDRKRVIQK